jgi:hypothetical protein
MGGAFFWTAPFSYLEANMAWTKEAAFRTGYVLLVEHKNFSPTVSVHDELAGVEVVLREIASALLADEWTDRNLVARLAEYGDHVRVFKCDDTGVNVEVRWENETWSEVRWESEAWSEVRWESKARPRTMIRLPGFEGVSDEPTPDEGPTQAP